MLQSIHRQEKTSAKLFFFFSLTHNSISMLLCTTQEGEDIPAGSVDGHKCSVIPRGHVWLEGDNPLASYDSRDHGAIPLALVYGRVRYKVCTCMLSI